MLQHLLPQTHPPVLQPQIGHSTPLTHLVAPGNASPQLLVSIDEAWELKLWLITADTAPVEYLSVPLAAYVLQAQWCQHTPGRLWCQGLEGQVGYYDFDLVKHQAHFHAFASLPALTESHRGLGFCQYHDHLLIFSHRGLWQTAIHEPGPAKETAVRETPAPLEKLNGPPEADLAKAQQVQMTVTADGLYLALLIPDQAQVFQLVIPETATAGTCLLVFSCDLETPGTADTAFLLAQQGQYLAIDRHVYDIHKTQTHASNPTRQTYYGRPLAFFDFATTTTKPCLLWASGDTLFTTALSAQGEILHHQEMQYTARYRPWPIFWSFAAADTRREAPTFWVADHHRHNASVVIAPPGSEALNLTHSLVGEGGWVESLSFTQQHRLYVGGGQKGTLCQVQLHQSIDEPITAAVSAAITITQHYQMPPQAVETLWKIPHQDSDLLLSLSAGVLRCHPAQESEAIEIPPPSAPWHKALENGALEQLAVLPKGWVAQFAYKGKVSIQHYNIATQQWQMLSQKLPEQAMLLAAISEQELLMAHDNPTGLFKIYFPHSQKWQDLPSELDAFDQILWNDAQQLLAILLEGEIEVWHHQGPGAWHACHYISQDAFFNGMAFSENTAELFTLDNEGHFKQWRIDVDSACLPARLPKGTPAAPKASQHTELSHWGPEAADRVVSISAEGRFIALGDRDQPLRIWDGGTGKLCYTLLACVNNEGTDTELAVILPSFTA